MTKKDKVVLITGISGQDGQILSRMLLGKGYEVHGIIRRSTSNNIEKIKNRYKDSKKLHIHYGDLSDANSINNVIRDIRPDELYNLGAQSFVKASFDKPEYTADITGLGVLRCLEAIRLFCPECRFLQASTSEMFGVPYEIPQNELTKFYPKSPYGVAKLYGYSIAVNYREAYGFHISNSICYNHESKFRGEEFVTRKISKAVASIKLGLQDCLCLGNLYSKRDWGYARDFCEAMFLMLQQDVPDDYVIATGETHSIKEFVDCSFDLANLSLKWEGEGEEEIGICKNDGRVLVRINPRYYRPAEVDLLLGDYSKAKRVLGWEPKVKFKELVEIMYKADYDRLKS